MKSCKYDFCNHDVHRASYQKHLRRKKHLQNENRNELFLQQWLFKEPNENKI